MAVWKKLLWTFGAGVVALAVFILFNNTNLYGKRSPGEPIILAHRGFSQTFDEEAVVDRNSCTATIIHQPTHGYLENTIPSMRAAFEAGADIVELDVHPTTDGQFAVFHDWGVDCRTEGKGVTRTFSMAQLKMLDIGYGYTADGGKTFPFRGKGIGMMPSLTEVIEAFPDRRFLINIKSNDADEGAAVVAFLKKMSPEQRDRMMVYGGGERAMAAVNADAPDVRTLSKSSAKKCLTEYIAYGWTGVVPPVCRHALVFMPLNFTWLWGWPDRYLNRMEAAGSMVFVIGPYDGASASGVDTPEMLARLPPGYSGGIYTNEIGVVAKALKPSRAVPASP
jgi:glycerophosphoryl diester phosphodiesterase